MSGTPEARVTNRLDDGVLIVTIDNPPVNAISAEIRAALLAAIEHAAVSDDVVAVVLTGAGRAFVGGADIREFDKPHRLPILPTIVLAIEALAKPIVAAINGVALGGGLELALGCHARIAAATAKVGLPEVKLGIVPGSGGTQRLPRLTGIPAAIELIASGRIVPAAEALSLGIVDRIAETDILAEAVTFARALIGTEPRRTGARAVPPADPAAIEAATAKALGRARGQPAPPEAVRLVRASAEIPIAEGVALERATFERLRGTEESAALRHLFFAEREAAKIPGLDGVAAREVRTIGIVGLGLMGAGIATAALEAGYHIVGVEQTAEAAEAGRNGIDALLARAVKSGRLDEAGRTECLSRLAVTGKIEDLADADLVIEAVFDDLEVKRALFARLDAIMRPDAILATNTSYLDPDALAAATSRPERVLGLHFFSPANVMRLLELVRCARTAPDVLATGLAVARRLGKLPVVSGVCEGFIGNRIFAAYRSEAEFLVEDGALPHEIDAAMEDYGFAMGPFAVFDMTGLAIAWARRKRLAATRDPSERYVEIPDLLCEAGRLGQKAGRGWYAYPEGKRRIDPEVTALIESARAAKSITRRAIPADEIVSRLLGAMSAEGASILAERIAMRPGDIDLVLVNGYGFPSHKGGPMFAAARARS
jgi:3-hydroxyacyl-CoA dehydrogenase